MSKQLVKKEDCGGLGVRVYPSLYKSYDEAIRAKRPRAIATYDAFHSVWVVDLFNIEVGASTLNAKRSDSKPEAVEWAVKEVERALGGGEK